MSARARKVFEASSDGLELYSIDEMFDGFDAASTRTLARTLHCNVRQFTGIPVCIDVAPSLPARAHRARALGHALHRAQRRRQDRLARAVLVVTTTGPN